MQIKYEFNNRMDDVTLDEQIYLDMAHHLSSAAAQQTG